MTKSNDISEYFYSSSILSKKIWNVINKNSEDFNHKIYIWFILVHLVLFR